MQHSLVARLGSRVLALFLVAAVSLAPSGSAQTPTDASLKDLRKQAQAAVQAGEFGKAVEAWRKITEADPKDGRAWHMLGYSLHADGKLDDALKIHMKAATFPEVAGVSCYNAACVYSLQQKKDEALQWLEKAVSAGFKQPEYLETDTDLDFLRKANDPRFEKILAAVQKMASMDAAAVQAYVQNVERRNTRIAWFSGNGSPGQIAIDYSPVPWKAEYEKEFAAGQLQGKKWRLGANYWTSLDTSIDVTIAGVKIPAGYYFLTAEQRDQGSFVLTLHDAAAVKKMHLDAYNCQKLEGGLEIPLQHTATKDSADSLEINLTVDEGSNDHGMLSIRFGGHALSGALSAKLGK